jgi:23S rRNA (cytosine1962-C5)-methyltransferase
MDEYSLLDSGDFEKLEQIGKYKIIRPSLNSVYKKNNPDLWKNVDAHYIKNEKGSGEWKFFKKIPESFFVQILDYSIKIKFTPFGHIGLFPEQKDNWKLIEKLGSLKSSFDVLNLFAYSGLSTIAALNSNFNVTHVDSSKGMISWAKDNVEASGLIDKKIRWIEDDVVKFIKREIKREKVYKGFILDPPSFGRGAKGEIFKIENNLMPLLEEMLKLCNFKPEFVILSCHSTGFSPTTLERILSSMIHQEGKFDSFELMIKEKNGNYYPSSFCAVYLSSSYKSIF